MNVYNTPVQENAREETGTKGMPNSSGSCNCAITPMLLAISISPFLLWDRQLKDLFFDYKVTAIYGDQEGAEDDYNPRKNGLKNLLISAGEN